MMPLRFTGSLQDAMMVVEFSSMATKLLGSDGTVRGGDSNVVGEGLN